MTVIGLVLTGAGIISPILWDQYKGRTELTLSSLGISSIIERKAQVQELRVLYGNRPVESVSKASFTLKNTGRKPIVKESVRQPIRVTFKANLLKQGIEEAFPRTDDYSIKKVSDNTLEIGFDLLNPNDFVTFSVLLDGGATPVHATGRIVGIKELTITDASRSRSELQGIFRKLGITGGIVLFFSTIALFIVVFMAIPEAAYEIKLKSRWASVSVFLKPPVRKAQLSSLIEFLLFPKTTTQMRPVRDALEKINVEKISKDKDLKALKEKLDAVVDNSSGAKEVAVLFAAMALVGLGYVISRVFWG